MKKLLLLILLLLPVKSFAKIYIMIEDPSSRKFPIAVPEFQSTKGRSSALTEEITDLVKTDLKIAGFFKVLDESAFLSPVEPGAEVDFSKWTAIEAHALLKGIVDGSGSNITIEMRLYDTDTKELLVGKQYKVSKKEYYVAIHRFMDDLMEALTGSKGPFNSQIAAACGKQGARQIYVTNIDGTGLRAVTKLKGNSIGPNWSPDGDTISFTSFVNRWPEIYSINSGGGGFKQLTSNKSTNITPSFSPNGGTIAFASSVSGDTELYTMSPSGKNLQRLTHVLNIDLAPAWSPDGSQLVFASERAGNLHLFSMSSSGGAANRLTYTGYQNDQPDWSPDGRKIVFTSRDRGAFDVFMMNADGSVIQRITRDEGNNESPTWSPDSRYITFSSARAGGAGLYVMLADGDNQVRIPDTESCINPDWGPWMK